MGVSPLSAICEHPGKNPGGSYMVSMRAAVSSPPVSSTSRSQVPVNSGMYRLGVRTRQLDRRPRCCALTEIPGAVAGPGDVAEKLATEEAREPNSRMP